MKKILTHLVINVTLLVTTQLNAPFGAWDGSQAEVSASDQISTRTPVQSYRLPISASTSRSSSTHAEQQQLQARLVADQRQLDAIMQQVIDAHRVEGREAPPLSMPPLPPRESSETTGSEGTAAREQYTRLPNLMQQLDAMLAELRNQRTSAIWATQPGPRGGAKERGPVARSALEQTLLDTQRELEHINRIIAWMRKWGISEELALLTKQHTRQALTAVLTALNSRTSYTKPLQELKKALNQQRAETFLSPDVQLSWEAWTEASSLGIARSSPRPATPVKPIPRGRSITVKPARELERIPLPLF